MPWPIYTELEQGVIDGQENPLWVMEVYKFYEIQKYMTLSRHVYSYHIDVASLKWWQTLDDKTQALVQDSHERRSGVFSARTIAPKTPHDWSCSKKKAWR